MTEGNLESTIMDRVGQSLLGIFKGECDPLSVVFADSLLHNIYEKGQTFIAANGVVKQILSLIRHKNTSLKVLLINLYIYEVTQLIYVFRCWKLEQALEEPLPIFFPFLANTSSPTLIPISHHPSLRAQRPNSLLGSIR